MSNQNKILKRFFSKSKKKGLYFSLYLVIVAGMTFSACNQLPPGLGNGDGTDTTDTGNSDNRCMSATKTTVNSLEGLRNAIDGASENGVDITLAAKTYDQVKRITISNKNCITIKGETSDYNDTVIKGIGIDDNSTMDINFVVINSDSVTFKNLTISDSYYHAIQVKAGSDYFVANHIKTWDNGESGFKVTANNSGSSPHYSDYGRIEHCLIGNTNGGIHSSVEGIDLVGTKDWVISGNTFDTITIQNSSRIAYAFFAKGNAIGTVLENNIVKNSDIAYSFGGGGTGDPYFRNNDTQYEHRGGIMRNNIAYNIKDSGIYMNQAKDFKVFNNTLVDVGQDGAGAIDSRFEESNGEIRNNIITGAANPITKRNGGTAVTSNNLTNASENLFVDPANYDYHLKSSASDAIDQGYALPDDVPVGFDGVDRPQGSGWDIGAFEYQ